MKEIMQIIDAYDKLDKSAVKLALATVIDVKGSSYRRTGARMLIQDNGIWTGGISGGCIEGNALKKANLAILNNEARIVTYDTERDDEAEIGVSLGCNGVISVLITPIDHNDPLNPIEQLRTLSKCRTKNLAITIIQSKLPRLKAGKVYIDKIEEEFYKEIDIELQKAIKEQIQSVIASRKSRTASFNELDLFIEYVPPVIRLIIAGNNYDIVPLLEIAGNLNWETIVIANPNRLSHHIKGLATKNHEDWQGVSIDSYTVTVIMGHDYNADSKNLAKALKTSLSYIGLLGPAIRKDKIIAELESNGVTVDKTRIFGPAGLDIGAAQPEEIAISIVSEIISVLRKRTGTSLKARTAPIHER